MPASAQIYDLVLLLSSAAPDEHRKKILTEVESAISQAGGAIERNNDWGTRNLAYQIDHQADAEYHLLQFSGPPALLESLSHSLKIDDGVLRFRIIKVLPGTPAAPDLRSSPAPAPVSQPTQSETPPEPTPEPEPAANTGPEPDTAPEPAANTEPGPDAQAETESEPEPAEA